MSINDHSVPLMSSLGGGYIMVTKKSPLLSAASKREIVHAVSNRQINSEIIEKNKQVIPARYKLVKTDCGIERVLVPADGIGPRTKKVQNSRPFTRLPLLPPRPLHPPHFNFPKNFFQVDSHVEDASLRMDVDEEEEDENEEIEILKVEKGKMKKCIPVIDIDCDDLETNPNEFKTMAAATLNPGAKTLHDRFTQLGTGLGF